ncbi:hypothetical protein L486_00143 [Kwoniella mangroviensis CBS 10435]|uniref:Uncharacterized protein n=1 Tax=Kwoniella mangroviensis CBS 10435 TaxID=1331196 RepID=A0A1B9IYB1_9TREE|nr:hypothetical protein L486_00143 [Kwoniella mangroviensis CBS 10435]OCF74742.1 hypothetical protein I204_05124 [Kwoniella mangroviensis CBS 8886]
MTAPQLYQELIITKTNAEKVFRGLAITPREGRVIRIRQDEGTRSLFERWTELWNLRVRPPYTLTYPYARVEEEDELDDNLTYPYLWRFNHYDRRYSSIASHHRKLTLLSYVKRLTIGSIPSRIVSQDFKSWCLLSSSSPIEQRLLPNIETIIITNQAIWELAEWTDKYQTNQFDKHPFIDGLINVSSPDKICMTYPRLHQDQYPKFLNDRIGHLKNILTSDEWSDKEEDLKRLFCRMAYFIDQAVLSFLQVHNASLSGWSPTEITLHGRRAGHLAFNHYHSLKTKSTRIFLDDCKIDHHRSPEPLTLCPQHTIEEDRKVHLGSIVSKDCRIAKYKSLDPALHNEQDQWELILPRPFVEEDESERLMNWERWKDEILSKNPTFNKDRLKITTWSGAESCTCCST